MFLAEYKVQSCSWLYLSLFAYYINFILVVFKTRGRMIYTLSILAKVCGLDSQTCLFHSHPFTL